jgi:hypothetical protein
VRVHGWRRAEVAKPRVRVEDHKIPAQPVESRALADEDLAVIAKEPDLDGLLVEEGSREALDSVA